MNAPAPLLPVKIDPTQARMVQELKHASPLLGCRIDPNPKSVDISDDVMKRFAKASRKTRMEEMAKALGPQKVRVFGTPADLPFPHAGSATGVLRPIRDLLRHRAPEPLRRRAGRT